MLYDDGTELHVLASGSQLRNYERWMCAVMFCMSTVRVDRIREVYPQGE
jgi:hypothetical protein